MTDIESRRYIGCKAKLAQWIIGNIQANVENAVSFCDLFAGTGIITKSAIDSGAYQKIIINDFLESNNIAYKAFFGKGQWNKKKLENIIKVYNCVGEENIRSNWFSQNYGGKYFDEITAKRIGYIREQIEIYQDTLTERERAILLTLLIYSIDRLANTVGHFDSYIKKAIEHKDMTLKLINAKSYDNVEIYKKDANELVRNIKADVVYIDPPYNSRQYSRFYHIYETLVKWNKPELYGVALKPKPSNMSGYCRSCAPTIFEDLVRNIDARYIAVSYNNTYTSKSHSSENKIKIGQIIEILKKEG